MLAAAFACLGIFGPFAQPAAALDPQKSITRFPIRSWDVHHGLAQNTIRGIAQTSDGYLWFATDGGLSRFDGVRFVTYTPSNAPGLRNGAILTVKASRDGGLWIGTQGGLCRMQGGRFTTYGKTEGLPSDTVFQIQETRDGAVWLATTAGLARFDNGAVRTYTTRDGLPADRVTSLAEDHDGGLWVGFQTGLVRLHDGVFRSFTRTDGLPADRVEGLFVDRSGAVWIGLSDAGICVWEHGRFTHHLPPGPARLGAVFSLVEDRDGQIWYASTRSGLHRLSRPGNEWDGLGAAQGLPDDAAWSVFEDREGNLWVGTQTAGLACLSDAPLTTYSAADGLDTRETQAVAQDPRGGMWAVASERLRHYQNGVWSIHDLHGVVGAGSGRVLFSVLADRKGRLWIGAKDGLVFESAQKIHRVPEIVYDTRALLEDRDGRLWAGTEGGLFRIDEKGVARYTTADGLVNNDVRCLLQDRAGDLWIGTMGGGITRMSRNGMVSYDTRSGLSGNGIRAMYEDADGAIWIGTIGAGLMQYRDGRFTAIGAEQGFSDESVFQILEDNAGYLWTCGAKGLVRVRRPELAEVASGRRGRVSAQTFGVPQGMRSPTCTNGTQPSAFKDTDGKLWFPTLEGLTVVDPSRVGPRRNSPPHVVLEEAYADRERLGPALTVPAGRDHVELSYTAPSFAAPERVVFRHRLDGLDRDWVETGTRRTAYYSRLPGGSYQFHVAAGYSDGTWDEQGLTIPLEVKPRYHETLWFRSAVVLSLASALFAAHLVRLRQEKARLAAVLAERERLAGELHDTLLQSYSAVGFHLRAVAETIVAAPKEAGRKVHAIIDHVAWSAAEARRSIWALRSAALENAELPAAIERMVERLATGGSTRCRVVVVGRPAPLAPAVEDHLLRIAQEAVTNALKHAAAREIVVTLDSKEKRFCMSVRDDGRGMDLRSAERTEGHFGLAHLKERARQLGATIEIESALDLGTELRLTLPRR